MDFPIELQPYNPLWAQQYELERQNITNAIGLSKNGGAIFKMAHVGSTSIPNMPAKACIDIAIDAYPTPLLPEKVSALESIGYEYSSYEYMGAHGIEGREYFRKGPDDFHLHIFDHDYPHWEEHIIFRDYLRGNIAKAKSYTELKTSLAQFFSNNRNAYQAGKSDFIAQTLPKAEKWYLKTTAFQPVEALANSLEGLQIPWHFSSGWALDLFTKTPSRYHDDIDIIIQRKHQLDLQKKLRDNGWDLHYVVAGQYSYWQDGMTVPEEAHQIHGFKGNQLTDILLEPDRTDQWVYRRNPEIKQSLELAFKETNSIPYLSPELVLLFKATIRNGKIRNKDQRDFDYVLPYLDTEQKMWLRQVLEIENEAHPWVEKLFENS